MNELEKLFIPFQPSIDHSLRTDVRYEERNPTSDLTRYIHCYWNLRTVRPLEESFVYRVVSDGCIDILFEKDAPEDIFITGFSSKFLEYELGKSFNYIGIRFLPVGFPTLFDIPANELTNSFRPLNEIVPTLYQTLSPGKLTTFDLDAFSTFVDELFVQIIIEKDYPKPDPRFQEAFHQILKSRGTIKQSELDLSLSERQLRRLFEYYFGESPKTFAKILRFQNILRAKPTSESLKRDKVFYDEGYYDQAHFIKEFKEFYGVTPGKAFGF